MNLALPSSKLPLVYRNTLTPLVTTLPYIDQELDYHTKQQVTAMILQEMQKMEKQDYLHDLPVPQTRTTDILRAEMDRIKQGVPMLKCEFEKKPKLNDETPESIKQSLDELNIAIQYSQINLLNQDLLGKYGKESWLMLIKSQENEKARLKAEVEKASNQQKHINAQRKYEQNEVKYKLDEFEGRIAELLKSNTELEVECQRLEGQVHDIRVKKLKLN